MTDTVLPDTSSTGINDSAKLVWRAIQATESFRKHKTKGKRRSIPGWYWSGTVNPIIDGLWPALHDRYICTDEETHRIKVTLNRFMRDNNVAVCTKTNGYRDSLWFVAEHWPELTVVPGAKEAEKNEPFEDDVVTDVAATADVVEPPAVPSDVFNVTVQLVDAQPILDDAVANVFKRPLDEVFTDLFIQPVTEPVIDQEPERKEETPVVEETTEETIDVPEHACRRQLALNEACEASFTGLHHRATHELSHGFRYNKDGSLTVFDSKQPVPDETQVRNMIIQVVSDQDPMTGGQITEEVVTINPRTSTSVIRLVLQLMLDEGWFRRTYTPLNPEVDARRGRYNRYVFMGPPKKLRKKAPKVMPELELATWKTIDKVATEADEHGNSDRLAGYRDCLDQMLEELQQLDTLRKELVDKTEELRLVTEQRDFLQGKLDIIKSAFGGILDA